MCLWSCSKRCPSLWRTWCSYRGSQCLSHLPPACSCHVYLWKKGWPSTMPTNRPSESSVQPLSGNRSFSGHSMYPVDPIDTSKSTLFRCFFAASIKYWFGSRVPLYEYPAKWAASHGNFWPINWDIGSGEICPSVRELTISRSVSGNGMALLAVDILNFTFVHRFSKKRWNISMSIYLRRAGLRASGHSSSKNMFPESLVRGIVRSTYLIKYSFQWFIADTIRAVFESNDGRHFSREGSKRRHNP